jgi:hypothetical protein
MVVQLQAKENLSQCYAVILTFFEHPRNFLRTISAKNPKNSL